MIEPAIRFCTSSDGTQLAYATLGSGPALVHVPGWSTNVELEWNDPEGRAWMTQVAANRMLVRCERRGVGASQRDVYDLSLDAQVEDVAAVVERLGLEEIELFAAYDGASIAIAFAATNPERVHRLVLWSPYTRGLDIADAAAYGALADLARRNWKVWLRTWADLCFPGGPTERQRWYGNLVRSSVSADVAARYIEFMRDVDVTPTAQALNIPTLVLHRSGDAYVPISCGRAVASVMHDARFVPLEGNIGLPVVGDNSYLQSMLQFLDEGRAPGTVQPPDGTAIILFTDIANSTALTEHMGDAAFRRASRTLDEQLRQIIREADGVPIEGKLLGDGVMAVFASAARAIGAARRCIVASGDSGLTLHVGLHAGDVIREADNVYGGAVNIAARICALSEAGEILVSGTVRDLARTSAGVDFADRGQETLKGVEDAVRLYQVRSQR